MPVRGVIRHEIQDQPHVSRVQLGDEPVERGKIPEQRVDAGVVGDVIAEIRHGRGVDRRDPNGVDPEPYQIIEAIDDALQVADTVTIAVLKRAG